MRFLICARDPLRRSAWSMLRSRGVFAIINLCTRPSAEIGVVDVKKQDFLRFLTFPCDPLRRSAWSKRCCCGAVRLCKVPDEPSAGIVRVEALSLWRRAWSLEVVAWLAQSHGRGFDPRLVRGSFSRQTSQLVSAN